MDVVTIDRGAVVRGDRNARIGTVDAVFADYLLVRTAGILPVDLYIPRSAITSDEQGRPRVEGSRDDAYGRWHRPLKRAPHD